MEKTFNKMETKNDLNEDCVNKTKAEISLLGESDESGVKDGNMANRKRNYMSF